MNLEFLFLHFGGGLQKLGKFEKFLAIHGIGYVKTYTFWNIPRVFVKFVCFAALHKLWALDSFLHLVVWTQGGLQDRKKDVEASQHPRFDSLC